MSRENLLLIHCIFLLILLMEENIMYGSIQIGQKYLFLTNKYIQHHTQITPMLVKYLFRIDK